MNDWERVRLKICERGREEEKVGKDEERMEMVEDLEIGLVRLIRNCEDLIDSKFSK